MSCDPRVIVQRPQRPVTVTRALAPGAVVAVPSVTTVVERQHDTTSVPQPQTDLVVQRPVHHVIERVERGPQGPPGVDGSPGGATGPTGATGPAGKDGQIRFTGHGAPPTVIVGASPGDTYLDLDTGDIYKLE